MGYNLIQLHTTYYMLTKIIILVNLSCINLYFCDNAYNLYFRNDYVSWNERRKNPHYIYTTSPPLPHPAFLPLQFILKAHHM